jgi:hypothetical protein
MDLNSNHMIKYMFFLGVAGPMLIDEIEKYTREINRTDDIHHLKVSHIGKLILLSKHLLIFFLRRT